MYYIWYIYKCIYSEKKKKTENSGGEIVSPVERSVPLTSL